MIRRCFMPLISLIIPVYKVEHYLHECINSVLNQSYKNIEIILIDDGSPDNCPAICDEYAKKDKRIKVIHKQNAGVSAARNTGLDHANGKYIMFCDSDDYVDSKWCEIFFKTAELNPNYWIFSNINKIINGEIKKVVFDQQEIADFKNNPSYYKAFTKTLSGTCYNKIYNAQVLKENNIRFDEDKSMCEDACFDALYFQKCSGVVFIEEPLYYYRDNASSITHSYQPNLFYSHICAFALRKTIVTKEELPYLCDYYYFLFIKLLDNPARQTSFFKKMRYNNKMMKSEEFRFCVANATGKNDSKLFMKVVRMHNYYIYWAFQKICKLKDKILRKNKSENKA